MLGTGTDSLVEVDDAHVPRVAARPVQGVRIRRASSRRTTLLAPRTETLVRPVVTTALLLLPTIFRTGSFASLTLLLAPRTSTFDAVVAENVALLPLMVTGPTSVAFTTWLPPLTSRRSIESARTELLPSTTAGHGDVAGTRSHERVVAAGVGDRADRAGGGDLQVGAADGEGGGGGQRDRDVGRLDAHVGAHAGERHVVRETRGQARSRPLGRGRLTIRFGWPSGLAA